MSDMPDKAQPTRDDRRRFLMGLAAAGGGAAAVAVTGQSAAAVAAVDDHAVEQGEQRGYQETQHVRDYYRTASS